MYNTQTPHHLVPLAEDILCAYRESSYIPHKDPTFREGYFAHNLALLLKEFDAPPEEN